MTDFQWSPAAEVDVTPAGMHSLANNGFFTTTEYDNSLAANRYLWGTIEITLQTAAAPTAGSTIDVFMLIAPDGTNYTDTDGPPPNAFVGQAVLAAVDGNTYHMKNAPLVPYKTKFYNKNASGQATDASGSKFLFFPSRTKTV